MIEQHFRSLVFLLFKYAALEEYGLLSCSLETLKSVVECLVRVQVKAAANAERRSYTRTTASGANCASDSSRPNGTDNIQQEALIQLLAQLAKHRQPES